MSNWTIGAEPIRHLNCLLGDWIFEKKLSIMNKILMVLVFGLVLATTAQPTNNAAEEKGKYSDGNDWDMF